MYGDANYDKIDWDVKVDFIRASSLLPSNKHAKQLKKWLQLYFTNPLKCSEVDISFCGLDEYGEFNSKIWMTIYNTCPAGELMSYSELAVRSNYSAGASKVVGYAINKNPYMLVVADHRVVKATGEIWTCDESQRNKLRRLLVEYEMIQAGTTVDEALLVIKERNAKTKQTRARTTSKKDSTSRKSIKKSNITAAKRKKRRQPEDDESDDSEDEILDDRDDE